MSESINQVQGRSNLSARIATILARLVVPVWVLVGATFKLVEQDPRNLPSVILKNAIKFESVDPDVLLKTLIGLEFFAALVMFLLPRLAKAMAIFMLGSFCVILLAEMQSRASSCGCFGHVKMKPWQMLAIDGTMLAAVIGFSIAGCRRGSDAVTQPKKSLAGSVVALVPLLAVGLAIGFFAVPARTSKAQEPIPDGNTTVAATHPDAVKPPDPPAATQADQPAATKPSVPTPAPPAAADASINPSPMDVPRSWYVKGEVKDWVGKPWREVELFKLMKRWPKDLDHGRHYVVFYSRSCEHCEAMVYDDLMMKPLDGTLHAVQIPASATEMTASDAWPMPPVSFELLELPLNCNYIITPPLAMRIEDGKITCCAEGEHKTCLKLE